MKHYENYLNILEDNYINEKKKYYINREKRKNKTNFKFNILFSITQALTKQ